jgi:hypothetical protein
MPPLVGKVEQRGAEAEALQDGGGVPAVDEHHDARAEQPEADGGHPDGAAGAERDPHADVTPVRLAGRRGHPQVGADGEPHPEVADRCREQGTDDEEDAAAELDAVVAGQQEEQEEDQADEPDEGPELAVEVGGGSLLNRLGNRFHVLRALAGSEYLTSEDRRHDERDQRDGRDDGDESQVSAGEGHLRAGCGTGDPWHPSSSTCAGPTSTRTAPPLRGAG